MEKQINHISTLAHENTKVDIETVIEEAAEAYAGFLEALRIDWKNDPNSKDTPRRVAKAYVQDLCKGRYGDPPNITSFKNEGQYDGMVFQGNIQVYSLCSHHHLPFIGTAHVAYIPTPDSQIIGLSKLNRIVEYFARRPQVQENLTMQIHNYINEKTKGNIGVAVMIEAEHMCAKLRGVKHDSIMKTSKLSGVFLDDNSLARNEFYEFINQLK